VPIAALIGVWTHWQPFGIWNSRWYISDRFRCKSHAEWGVQTAQFISW